MILGAVFGAFGTILGLWGLYRLVLSGAPFQVGDDPVPNAEFLIVAIPFLALYLSACLTAGAASWALWKRHPRFRVLLAALLAEFVVGDAAMLSVARRSVQISNVELATSILGFSILVALGLWYLFRKDSVVSYYEAVRRGAASAV